VRVAELLGADDVVDVVDLGGDADPELHAADLMSHGVLLESRG
jgi:hypothetical protein